MNRAPSLHPCNCQTPRGVRIYDPTHQCDQIRDEQQRLGKTASGVPWIGPDQTTEERK